MMMSSWMMIIVTILPLIFPLINYLLNKSSTKLMEKKTPYECGFSPLTKSSTPFSNNFFMIMILFLIFDVEITLLIPTITIISSWTPLMILMIFLFTMFMIIGLYFEWSIKSIEWVM